LNSSLEEETITDILIKTGKKCIHPEFINRMKHAWEGSRDLDNLITAINTDWTNSDANAKIYRMDDSIFAEYGECYCSLVRDYPGRVPPLWCECSRGWLIQLFESILEKPVDVRLLKSVKRGDEKCLFQIFV
jgi:predicted hydrocarbon binding protein